jgi:predicted nuclease of predicted toxin-antitoxin system
LTIWIDAQLSPQLAPWLGEVFSVVAVAVRDLGLRNAKDREIFFAARAARATVMSKDSDFVALQEQLGPPPQLIWVTCGNTSNAALRGLFERNLPRALELLRSGEPLVEVGGASR